MRACWVAALLAAIPVTATAGLGDDVPLPSPLEAGWEGRKVCELLTENAQVRTLRCTFASGAGHERHYHRPHWGYILTDATMRITTEKGTVVRKLKAGSHWWSDGIAWHEVLNIGDTTGVYLIVEPK